MYLIACDASADRYGVRLSPSGSYYSRCSFLAESKELFSDLQPCISKIIVLAMMAHKERGGKAPYFSNS
jgi:hypothetical protein